MENEKKRNSSIEALKIIAILMIVFSHSTPAMGEDMIYDLSVATTDFQQIVSVLIRYLGQLGNAIFIICSSWFLLEDDKIKLKKIIRIILDTIVISVLWLAIFLLLGNKPTIKEIINHLLPTTTQNDWFVGCYIIFYSIHPLLNIIIKNIEQKCHLLICLLGICVYCIFTPFVKNYFYYSELIGFILIYFLCAYIKKYLKGIQENSRILGGMVIFGIIGVLGVFGLIDYLGLHLTVFSKKMLYWTSFSNIFNLCIAFGMFCLFQRKEYYNKTVNYLSSLSLLIYVIHEDYFMYTYLRNDIFHFVLQINNSILLWVIIIGFITSLFVYLIAIIYNITSRKVFNTLAEKIEIFLTKRTNFILDKLIK